MNKISLNGSWLVSQKNESETISASVPGSIYLDLMSAKKIEDPFYGINEELSHRVYEKDWIFSREFEALESMLAFDKIFLECDGIDTLAGIKLNGHSVGKVNNMHRRFRFEVSNFLAKHNKLEITIYSPVNYVTPLNEKFPLNSPEHSLQGGPYLRKCASSFGWDWGPKIPDMGIWRDIRIVGFDKARIDDIKISQRFANKNVDLHVAVKLENWSQEPLRIKIKLFDPNGKLASEKTREVTDTAEIEFSVPNPQPWWPNGYGGQPLYEVQIQLRARDQVVDSIKKRIGLRKLSVVQNKDDYGRSFTFMVNDVTIFARGANWIPGDNFIPRITPEKYHYLIKSAAFSHFNMLRVWGGGIYENDIFYDFCDQYGILVWQDFMFSCSIYPIDAEFVENVKLEAIDNIRRLRHHPCIALWCGNNEMEWGWVEWGWQKAPDPELKAGYQKMFGELLPAICGQEDPERLYWPSSPSSGGNFYEPNAEDRGDGHYWDVWHGRQPFTAYRKHFFRFMSEFGFESFPSIKTIKSFAPPAEWNMFSRIMENHQKNSSGNELILYYISQIFRLPASFEDQVYVSQLLQAEAIRYGVEHWRRHRGRCMGTLYWQLNDCWPVASWSSIDYYGRWKALQFFAKRFFQPILVSARETGTEVALHVSNETRSRFSGELKWRLMNEAGVLKQGSEKAAVEQLSGKQIIKLNFEEELAGENKYHTWLAYKLVQGEETISSGTTIFVPYKHFDFIQPDINANITREEDQFEIIVSSDVFTKFIELDLLNYDAIFSDNYFDLIPGEMKVVTVIIEDMDIEEFEKKLVIKNLYDAQA